MGDGGMGQGLRGPFWLCGVRDCGRRFSRLCPSSGLYPSLIDWLVPAAQPLIDPTVAATPALVVNGNAGIADGVPGMAEGATEHPITLHSNHEATSGSNTHSGGRHSGWPVAPSGFRPRRWRNTRLNPSPASQPATPSPQLSPDRRRRGNLFHTKSPCYCRLSPIWVLSGASLASLIDRRPLPLRSGIAWSGGGRRASWCSGRTRIGAG